MQRRTFLASAGMVGLIAGCEDSAREPGQREPVRGAKRDPIAEHEVLSRLVRDRFGDRLTEAQFEEIGRRMAGHGHSVSRMRAYALSPEDAPVFAPSSLVCSSESSK